MANVKRRMTAVLVTSAIGLSGVGFAATASATPPRFSSEIGRGGEVHGWQGGG